MSGWRVPVKNMQLTEKVPVGNVDLSIIINKQQTGYMHQIYHWFRLWQYQ